MKKNMGATDRVIRAALAIALITLYTTGIVTGTLGIALLIIAGVFMITAMVSVCPLYLPFGLSTMKKDQRNVKHA